jgi:hypothetical protein
MKKPTPPSPEDLLETAPAGALDDELDIELEAEPDIYGQGVLLRLAELDMVEKDDKRLLVFRCDVVDGDFAGRRMEDLFDINNPNQVFKRNMWAKALQVPVQDGKVRIRRSEVVGRMVVANIVVDPVYGSKIKSMAPASAELAAKHSDVL